ncbi:MAG TPA: HlyD family efflux transporter periplasmic adaptor subunit [Candidatus Paceibacterota bacterium]
MNIKPYLKPFIGVIEDFRSYFNPKTKTGRIRLGVLAVILIALFGAFKFFGNKGPAEVKEEAPLSQVSVMSVAELGSQAQFDTIGKVEAVSEANLQTEAGGRITSVNVKIGDSVRAGTVLATIENSAQRAALVQAQGSYEAALAASAQSGVGLSEAQTGLTSAKNSALNTVRSAYSTVNSAINNSIDPFFGNPDGQIPGLKIDGAGYTSTLNAERVAYQTLLPSWQTRSNAVTTESNLESELNHARNQVERTIAMVDMFIDIFNQEGNVSGYSEAELQTFSTNFTTLRASLISQRSQIDAAIAGLNAAEDAVERSQLAASGGQVSASDAQIKIALGALQAAQSAYSKTVIRTPISGVVNAFYLKTGDFAAPGMPAAIVANNNGLQIKTFVNEADSANLSVGDTVTIEGSTAGVITAKADALDPTNGKVAVVVGVDEDSELTNGATVKVTFSQLSKTETSDKVIIPLSALKITADGSYVYTVNAENKLESMPVTQGQLFGENIEIVSGLTKETRIVTDARGLKEGQEVTLKN